MAKTTGHWLTKDDAAAAAGCSTRQIERLAAAGKIRTQRTRLPGDRSDRTVYAEADLTTAAAPSRSLDLTPAPAARRVDELLAMLQPPRPPRAWLTLEEAAEHSGLPVPAIAALIDAGHVYAIGRGLKSWRVQRSSLDAFGEQAHKRGRK